MSNYSEFFLNSSSSVAQLELLEISHPNFILGSVEAKSIIFDIADNHGSSSNVGIRSIDFYYEGNKLPLTASDLVAYATSDFGASYVPANAFDTTLSKIGSPGTKSWQSDASQNTNQRLIVVFNESQIFDQIVINNFHSSGNFTNKGAKTVKISYSNQAISDTTYDASIAGGVVLGTSDWQEHVASDELDHQTVYTKNDSFKIVRNAVDGVTVTLEDLSVQTFDYYPLRIVATETREDLDFSLQVELGDLGEILPKEIDAISSASGFSTKPIVKYRVYRSDDLTAPLVGPYLMEVDAFNFNREGSNFTAKAPSLNITGTGELYKIDRFTMLRGFL